MTSLPDEFWSLGMTVIAGQGDVEILKEMIKHENFLNSPEQQDYINRCMQAAYATNKIDVLKFVVQKYPKLDDMAMRSACHVGHLEIIKYLLSQGLTYSDCDLEIVCNQGHKHVLDFFYFSV